MEKIPSFRPNPDLKLMDQVREVLRYYHYAYRTEQTYCDWILRYIRFHGGQTHPKDLKAVDIERFLSDLVSSQKVAAATQKQALNALVFLYHKVLHLPLLEEIARCVRKNHPVCPRYLPPPKPKFCSPTLMGHMP